MIDDRNPTVCRICGLLTLYDGQRCSVCGVDYGRDTRGDCDEGVFIGKRWGVICVRPLGPWSVIKDAFVAEWRAKISGMGSERHIPQVRFMTFEEERPLLLLGSNISARYLTETSSMRDQLDVTFLELEDDDFDRREVLAKQGAIDYLEGIDPDDVREVVTWGPW